MPSFLEFEKPIAELEGKIEELRHLTDGGALNIADEVGRMQEKVERLLRTTYSKLTPWQKVLVARHPERPHALEYIENLFEDYLPLAGDRAFAEDPAIAGGLARFDGRSVMVIGNEKGHDTEIPPEAQFRHGPAGGLSQGDAPDAAGRNGSACRSSHWSIPQAPIREWARRRAARPKPSPARSKPASIWRRR